MLGMLFYRNLFIAIGCIAGCIPVRKIYSGFLNRKRKEALLEGFRDTLYIIAGSVAAGRQMPVALRDAYKQCSVIYGDSACITRELGHICSVYEESHGEAEDLLMDFGKRSGQAEIIQFASSYEICRKNGGDAEAVCMKSADLLLDKIEFKKEASALISEKKLDIAVLTAMPIGMILFLNIVSYEYLSPLYGNPQGITIMTVSLLLIAIALKISLKITDIDL